jgi:hypothetical protein
MKTIWLVFICCLPLGALAESTLTGDLPRRENKQLEQIPGVDSRYGVLQGPDGRRLRTILTRPSGTRGRLPAILFVQWLSCDSIELPAKQQDGWSRMLRRLAQDSGMVLMRTEKAGVGDSEGDCASLDYETELAGHRAALAALRRSPDVDPARIVIFGASMGGNYAPLVAAGEPVAGVMIWGGGAQTWFERMLGFERRAKELAGVRRRSSRRTCRRSRAFSSLTCSTGRIRPPSSGISRHSPARGRGSSAPVPEATTDVRSLSTSRRRPRTGPVPGRASTPPCSCYTASTTGSRTRQRTGWSRISRPAAAPVAGNSFRFPRPTTTSTVIRTRVPPTAGRAARTMPTPP